MSEAEFMTLAHVGQSVSPAINPRLVFPALIEFLHANGHHDIARVVERLLDDALLEARSNGDHW